MNYLKLRERVVRETGDLSLVGESGGAPDYTTDGSGEEGALQDYINEAIDCLLEEASELQEQSAITTTIKGGTSGISLPRVDRVEQVYMGVGEDQIHLRPRTYNQLKSMTGVINEDELGAPAFWARVPRQFGLPPTKATTISISESPNGMSIFLLDDSIYLCKNDGTIWKYSLSGTLEDTISITVSLGTLRYHVGYQGLIYAVFKADTGDDALRVYNENGVLENSFTLGSENVNGITVTKDTVYAVEGTGDTGTLKAYRFDGTERWSTNLSYLPVDVTSANGYLYVRTAALSGLKDRVYVYDDEDGVQAYFFASPNGGEIAASQNGIYAISDGNIGQYSKEGQLVSRFGATSTDDVLDSYHGIATEDGSHIVVGHVDSSTFTLQVWVVSLPAESGEYFMIYPAPQADKQVTVLGTFYPEQLTLANVYEETEIMRDYWRYIVYRACALWALSSDDGRITSWNQEAMHSLRNMHDRQKAKKDAHLKNAHGNFQIQEY